MDRAVFFDKDGTLVFDLPYNVDPALIRLREDAAECLRLLNAAGFKLYIVSNQSGVAHGFFGLEPLATVQAKIEELAQISFDGFYYCPHLPNSREHSCKCRKPQPGLLLRAAKENELDLAGSWLVGDILNDIEAGRRAGVRTIFLDVGSETEWIGGEFREPDFRVKNLFDAAQVILEHTAARCEKK